MNLYNVCLCIFFFLVYFVFMYLFYTLLDIYRTCSDLLYMFVSVLCCKKGKKKSLCLCQ